MRRSIAAPLVALALMGGGSVALAGPASAGTTWNSIGGAATAASEVKHGTTWNSIGNAAAAAGEVKHGTTWNSIDVDSLAELDESDGEVVTLASGVPSCSTVSFWTRVRALLGSGECR